MKAFLIWLAAMVVLFGGFGAYYHSDRTDNPDQVLVVVDSSFDMEDQWADIDEILDSLDNEKYSEYALATDKTLDTGDLVVHGWQEELEMNDTVAYGRRDLSPLLEDNPDTVLTEANELILVTNAPDSDLEPFGDWTIVKP